MCEELSERFRDAFFRTIQSGDRAEILKQAAMSANLSTWTSAITSVVVATCEAVGLKASAKGHKLELLPIHRSEYLSLDVMAFPKGEQRWRFPAAVMELENGKRDDQIAYSLWKVMAVHADLRAVFCYRKQADQATLLIRHLQEEVVGAMEIIGRMALEGRTLVVVGSRDESSTFPYGFFSWWELNTNTGKFERL